MSSNKTYNLAELFSGIGSQAKALSDIGADINTVCTCEWDIHAMIAYDAIHCGTSVLPDAECLGRKDLLRIFSGLNLSNNGKEKISDIALNTCSVETLRRVYSAIKRTKNKIDISVLNGMDMPWNIDIMTYSFPCQDLSNAGAFHGYNKGIDKNSGSRSSLLWQVGRILEEMAESHISLPRFLVLENVPALLSKRHRANFGIWQNDLKRLGYHNKIYTLNASWYGIPQNRPRLIMISVLTPEKCRESHYKELDQYYECNDLSDEKYYSTLPLSKNTISELLRTDYSDPVLLEEALESQPNDTPSRREIWEENPVISDESGEITCDIIRTITTKQDRNPNSGNIYFDYPGNKKSKFRYLTPRECFLFMGFSEKDYERIIDNNPLRKSGKNLFTRDKLIRMAGNSIPVHLLRRVFFQVLDIDKKLVSRW